MKITNKIKKHSAVITIIALITTSALPLTVFGGTSAISSSISFGTAGALVKSIVDFVSAKSESKSDKLLRQTIEETATDMLKSVDSPKPGSTYGDWAVIGLVQSGIKLPDNYVSGYVSEISKYLKDNNGVLSTRKYTDYSRTILSLTCCGSDPLNISGFNLVKPLGDYENTIRQGINGAAWALISLDSAGYEIPVCEGAKVQATRQMYVDYILQHQLSDGGFSMSNENSDPDVTAMCLYALYNYTSQPKVSESVQRSVACLSELQTNDGGFSSYGTSNAESISQVIISLSKYGISVDGSDSRFVKNGTSLLDALMSFNLPKQGFSHLLVNLGGSRDEFATEQSLLALISVYRCQNNMPSVYTFK